MKHLYQTCQVFSNQGIGGNGACIFEDQGYSDAEKQRFATLIGLSEIVFINKKEDGYHLRYFTPEQEIEMCGHATIAAAAYIHKVFKDTPEAVWANGQRIGVRYDKSRVLIELGEAEWLKDLPIDEKLASSVGIGKEQIGLESLTPTIYRSGIADILLPVVSLETLEGLVLNPEVMIELSKREQVVGVHAFTIKEDVIYARNFAPLYGIDEENATGTSNNSLIAYLAARGVSIPEKGTIIQGIGPLKGRIDFVREDKSVFVGGEVTWIEAVYELE